MTLRSSDLLIIALLCLGVADATAESMTQSATESSTQSYDSALPLPSPTVASTGLTGDWGGFRSSLIDHGLTPSASYTTGFWSNLVGGLETGVRYLGFAEWGFEADFDRLVDWRGGGFHIGWLSYHGGEPSERLVGSFPLKHASGLEAEQSIRFYEIYLEQTALGDRLYAKVGQLALDQDFMVADHASRFRNAAFGDFVTNGTEGTNAVYPLAAPGIYLDAEPWPDWRIRIGAYTADPGDDERDNYGFDGSFSSRKGVTIFGEIALEKAPFDLPGTYIFGVGGQTGNVEDFERGGESDGLQIFYTSVDQTLYRSKRPTTEEALEIGAFLRAAVPVQSERATFAWQMNGGVEVIGALPGRPADSFGIGVVYVDYGHDYLRSVRTTGVRAKSRGTVFELMYRAQLTRWLSIQPDLQYAVDPQFGRRDSLAFGLVAEIDL